MTQKHVILKWEMDLTSSCLKQACTYMVEIPYLWWYIWISVITQVYFVFYWSAQFIKSTLFIKSWLHCSNILRITVKS